MATLPFDYDCDMGAGFVLNPNEHKRFGYVTSLNGFGLPEPLKKDLTLSIPYNTGASPEYRHLTYRGPTKDRPMGSVDVVGVLDQFTWDGGVADPIKLEFSVSQENAMQIIALQQHALKTTDIKSLAWWIADYDQEVKQWFEQSYPISSGGGITGHINGGKDPVLEVDPEPVIVQTGVDINVYKVKLEVVPAGSYKYKMHFASSHMKKVIRTWGVIIGKVS